VTHPPRKFSFACPRCGSPAKHISAEMLNERYWRRRQCNNTECSFMFSTVEVLAERLSKSEPVLRAYLRSGPPAKPVAINSDESPNNGAHAPSQAQAIPAKLGASKW